MAKNPKTPEIKRPVGRPSDYRPEYCEMLIEHMRGGMSFESFAGIVEATKQTIYSWTEKFPEFLDAKHKGTELSRVFWEKLAIQGIWNHQGEGARNLNTRLWEINMHNRFGDEWKRKNPEAGDVNVAIQVNNQMQVAEAKAAEAQRMLKQAFDERKPIEVKKIEGK